MMQKTESILLAPGAAPCDPALWLNAETVPPATPDRIAALKQAPFLFRSLARMALHLRHGTLVAITPEREVLRIVGAEPGPVGVLIINDYKLGARVMRGGNVGFAEAYMDGLWDSPDVTAVLEVFSLNTESVRALFTAQPLVKLINRIGHAFNRNSKTQARKNIEAHYDLGNDFYEAWLDPTMTYSSARFAFPGQDLAAAQENKYRSLADRIHLTPDHSVLEIGCGWGGFAEFAAKEIGCRLTGITISPKQYEFARKRMFDQGLAEKVDIQLRDYRDVDGEFDRITSIEMFEAVGEAYWPRFFDTIRTLLRRGGEAGLQIITIRDDQYEPYRNGVDFIQRYVFPGGMLPSPSVFAEQVSRAKLTLADTATFGRDYAATLAAWRERFLAAWPRLAGSDGFDDRFRRLWTYYLSYCEAGFRAGTIDVAQVRLRNP